MEPGEQIDQLIAGLNDWRGETLANLRRIIHEADPGITETWKWRGAPVWEHAGIVMLAVPFKAKVKVTFYSGAHLPDPDGLFNAELEGKQWRAIDYHAGDQIDERALKTMILAAVQFNQARASKK